MDLRVKQHLLYNLPSTRYPWTTIRECVDENNVLHCDNEPAVMWNDGLCEWFKHGKRHRLDGPATYNLYNTEIKAWWVNGLCFETEERFHKAVIMFLFDCDYETAHILKEIVDDI